MGICPAALGGRPDDTCDRRLKVKRLDADGNETGRLKRSGDLAFGSGRCLGGRTGMWSR